MVLFNFFFLIFFLTNYTIGQFDGLVVWCGVICPFDTRVSRFNQAKSLKMCEMCGDGWLAR